MFGESIFVVFFMGESRSVLNLCLENQFFLFVFLWGNQVCFEFVFGESIFFFMGESRSVLNLCLVDRDRDKGGYKYEDK